MHGDEQQPNGQPGRDDIFPEWVVFPRNGGGWLAVHKRTGRHVEGDDQDALTAAVVAANVIRTWREGGLIP